MNDVTVTIADAITIKDGDKIFEPVYIFSDAPYAHFLEYGTQPSQKKPGPPSKRTPAFSTTTNKMSAEKWKEVSPGVKNIAEWLKRKESDAYRASPAYISAKGGDAVKSYKVGHALGLLSSEKELYKSAQAIFSKLMRDGMPPHPFFRAGMYKALADINNKSYKPDNYYRVISHIVRTIQKEIRDSVPDLWCTGELVNSIQWSIEPPQSDVVGADLGDLWKSENAKRGLGKWGNAEYDTDGERL